MLVCGDPEAPETYFAGYPKDQVSPISCPDNVAFDRRGNLWISTDGNELGSNDGLFAVPTAGPQRGRVRQFLTVPVGAETCGPLISGDGKTVFTAVQHPGEVDGSTFEDPASTWPHTTSYPIPSVVTTRRVDGAAHRHLSRSRRTCDHQVAEGVERVAGRAGRQLVEQGPRPLGPSQHLVAGLVERGMGTQQRERLGQPAVVTEVARQQLAQPRVAGIAGAQGQQHRQRGHPLAQVGAGRLARLGGVTGHVEDVVGQLERGADVLAVLGQHLLLGGTRRRR